MKHALWLVGFRPFFILAIVSGALLPLLWALIFLGWAPLPQTGLSSVQWHAHEMLYGFGWAVMGGFLLTASKNWVKTRGMHGGLLVVAVLLWLFERIALFTLNAVTLDWMRFIVLNVFLLFVVGYVVTDLVRFRKQDSFRDNGFFIIGLPLFLFAKTLVLSGEHYAAGVTLSIGLFRLAFAVMFERTITQFMNNTFAIEIYRKPYLDLPIKFLVLLAAFQSFLPSPMAAVVLAGAGLLLLLRFFLWSPLKGLSRFGIAIMYVGYLGLTLHFLTESLKAYGVWSEIGTVSVHIFTFLTMGIVIPGMLIRISQGHTGRPIQFTLSDRFAISAIAMGAFFRIIATQVWPVHYSTWIALAGIGWTLCYVALGVRLIPFLWQPRVDGRET